jgi:hypothetical protein
MPLVFTVQVLAVKILGFGIISRNLSAKKSFIFNDKNSKF